MKYTIRRLDPTIDSELYATAYSWLRDGPQWRRDSEAVDRATYLAAVSNPRRLDIGVFTDELVAIISLLLTGPNAYEVCLEAKRGVDAELLVIAASEVRDQMWRYGAEAFCTYTPSWNRRVVAINKALGFQPTGVTMHHGSVHGRTIEWDQYLLINPRLCRAAA